MSPSGSGRENKLALGLRLLLAEGPRSLRDRWHDRARDAERRRSFYPVPLREVPSHARSLSVVHLLSAPPSLRRGGLPQHFLERWEEEARQASIAAIYPETSGPEPGAWRLEIESGGHRRSARLEGPALASLGVAPRTGMGTSDAVTRFLIDTLIRLGAPVAHFDGLAGWPLPAVRELARHVPVLLSLHDFAAFCPRPHLIEEPAGLFCDFCRDLDRCGRCLAHGSIHTGATRAASAQGRYRADAEALLTEARGLIFASRAQLDDHRRLYPLAAAALDAALVIEPAPRTPVRESVSSQDGSRGARTPGTLHVAYAGSLAAHKGSDVFEQLVRLGPPGVRFAAWGGGTPEVTRRLRALGVEVHGYYPAGTLPERLRAAGTDVGLLPSIWPEAYARTLDEVWAAGLPAVAFDHGALAERIRRRGGGWLVDPADGARGLAELLTQIAATNDATSHPWPASQPSGGDAASGAGPERAARELLTLCHEIRTRYAVRPAAIAPGDTIPPTA